MHTKRECMRKLWMLFSSCYSSLPVLRVISKQAQSLTWRDIMWPAKNLCSYFQVKNHANSAERRFQPRRRLKDTQKCTLCCEFILSLFWCVEPLKKIRGCGWVFLLIGLALLRTTLCACSRSFWGGAENRSLTGFLIWPAHFFRHFLRRVQGTKSTTRHP